MRNRALVAVALAMMASGLGGCATTTETDFRASWYLYNPEPEPTKFDSDIYIMMLYKGKDARVVRNIYLNAPSQSPEAVSPYSTDSHKKLTDDRGIRFDTVENMVLLPTGLMLPTTDIQEDQRLPCQLPVRLYFTDVAGAIKEDLRIAGVKVPGRKRDRKQPREIVIEGGLPSALAPEWRHDLCFPANRGSRSAEVTPGEQK